MSVDASRPTSTVVVCSYTLDRWHLLERAIQSVLRQERPADEVVLVVDHNETMLDQCRKAFPSLTTVSNTHRRGLSGARNTGVELASSEVIVFLDDDAVAAPDWLEQILRAYRDPTVAGVGGLVRADWDSGRPRWFPEEFDWVVGCTYRGLPSTAAPVRNLIGASMSLRASALEAAGPFREDLGRIGATPLGCEETDICLRIAEADPEAVFVFDPTAIVDHLVPSSRSRLRYFTSRCYAEGLSKALVVENNGPQRGLASERTYATRTLPAAVGRGIADATRGDIDGLSRAGTVGLGLMTTAAGYTVGRCRNSDHQRDPQRIDHREAPMDWHVFDIHNMVRMRVAVDAPTAHQLCHMFAHFLQPDARDCESADITVTGTLPTLDHPAHGEYEFTFTDDAVVIEAMGSCIERDGDRWRVHGTREMLTTVLPLVDRIAVTHSAAMGHAATVVYDGKGIAMPAWGGVGKTSTMSQLVKMDEVAFLGDDWAFVDSAQRLYGFHKPMYIKPHHREIYPHMFEGARKPLVPSSMSKSFAKLTTAVHPLATRYPKVADRFRRWTPEYKVVTPQEAFPDARFADSAPLRICIFVERADLSGAELREVTEEWMVTKIVGNFHAEMSPQSRDVFTALATTAILPLQDVMAEKAEIVAKAIAGLPTFRLQVPTHFPPSQAAPTIVAEMERAMALGGV